MQTLPSPGPSQSGSKRREHAIAAVLIVIVVVGTVLLWKSGFLTRISNRGELVQSLRQAGPEGPLLCIGIQFIQVVIFIIPWEITQFAAGYVFGTWKAFIYSVIGIVLGSGFNFYFARIVGRPVIERLVSRATMAKVDKLLTGAKAKSALFLLFLLPGTPKDALSYGAGFSRLGLVEFCLISGLGRCPALLASIMLGAQASQRNYRAMIATGCLLIFAVAGYYLYERYRTRKQASLKTTPD